MYLIFSLVISKVYKENNKQTLTHMTLASTIFIVTKIAKFSSGSRRPEFSTIRYFVFKIFVMCVDAPNRGKHDNE